MRFLAHNPVPTLIALVILAFTGVQAGTQTSEPQKPEVEMKTLEGTVRYRERMALPAGADLEVKLVDVSRADAPAEVLAESRTQPDGQVPLPYRLDYRAADIVEGRSYALQARITFQGQLIYITTSRHSVFGPEPNQTEILVERVGISAGTSPTGRWLAEDIGGGGVIDRLQTILEIAQDGTVSGTGGCNRMVGRVEVNGKSIRFSPLASTEMACTPVAMDQEAKFFAALASARGWRVDGERQKLELLDDTDRVIMLLAKL